MDPHSAVGFLGIKENKKINLKKMNNVFLGTAHPSKFADIIEPIIDERISMPDRLRKVLNKDKRSIIIKNNYVDFFDYLIKTFQ